MATTTVGTAQIEVGAVDKASAVFSTIKGNLGGLVAGVAGLTGAAMIGKSTIGSYSSFETSVARVNTMLGDGEDAMDKYGGSLRDMALEIPVSSVNELADGLYQTLSASIDTEQAMGLVEVAAKTAKAGATDTFTAVDALTSIVNAYGLEATDAESISDKLFATYKRGKITVDELAGNIGNVAATGAQLGVSLDDILAGFSTMTRSGISADEVATGLTATMNAFLKPTGDMTELMNKYGYENGVAMLKNEGLAGSLGILKDEVDGGNYQLADLTANIRAMKLAFPLTGDKAQEFRQDISEISGATGDMSIAYEKMASTTASDTQKFKNAMNDLKISVGEGLVPVLNNLLDVVKPLLTVFKEHSGVVSGLVVAVGLLSAALITLKLGMMISGVVNTLSNSMALWSIKQTLLNTTLYACPLVWIVAAIIAVIAIVAILVLKWDEVKKALGKAWDWMKEKFGALKDAIGNGVNKIKEKWGEFKDNLAKKAGEIIKKWAELGGKIAEGCSNLKSKLGDLASKAKEKLGEWKDSLLNAMGKAGEWLKETGKKIIMGLVKGFVNFGNTIKDWTFGVWNCFKNVFSNAINWLFNVGKDIILGLINGIKSIPGKISDAIGGIKDTIVGGVKNIFGIGSPSTLMEGYGKNLVEGMNQGITGTKVAGIGVPSVSANTDRVSMSLEKFTNALQKTGDMIENIFHKMGDSFNTMTSSLQKSNMELEKTNMLRAQGNTPGQGGGTNNVNVTMNIEGVLDERLVNQIVYRTREAIERAIT